MLTMPANLTEFVVKSVIDLNVGRQTFPLVYQPLYRTLTDPNFTELVDVATTNSQANVIFLDHVKGEEVQFGTCERGPLEMAGLITWTAGFEYTEDMVEYDRT
jgi:hypothetical protein